MRTIEDLSHDMAEQLPADPGRCPVCVWCQRRSWADPYEFDWGYGAHEHPEGAELVAADILDLSDAEALTGSAVQGFADEVHAWLASAIDEETPTSSHRSVDPDQLALWDRR